VDLDWTGKAPARDMGEDVKTVAANR